MSGRHTPVYCDYECAVKRKRSKKIDIRTHLQLLPLSYTLEKAQLQINSNNNYSRNAGSAAKTQEPPTWDPQKQKAHPTVVSTDLYLSMKGSGASITCLFIRFNELDNLIINFPPEQFLCFSPVICRVQEHQLHT